MVTEGLLAIKPGLRADILIYDKRRSLKLLLEGCMIVVVRGQAETRQARL